MRGTTTPARRIAPVKFTSAIVIGLLRIPVRGAEGPVDSRHMDHAIDLADPVCRVFDRAGIRHVERHDLGAAGKAVRQPASRSSLRADRTSETPDLAQPVRQCRSQSFARADQPVAFSVPISHVSSFRRIVATSSATFIPYLRNWERFTMVPFGARYIQSLVLSTWPPARLGQLDPVAQLHGRPALPSGAGRRRHPRRWRRSGRPRPASAAIRVAAPRRCHSGNRSDITRVAVSSGRRNRRRTAM